MSQVCKRQMMERFLNLCGKLESSTGVEGDPPSVYNELKEAAESYQVSSSDVVSINVFTLFVQSAKDMLLQAFSKANLGSWVHMPIEQDQFEFQ